MNWVAGALGFKMEVPEQLIKENAGFQLNEAIVLAVRQPTMCIIQGGKVYDQEVGDEELESKRREYVTNYTRK